MSDVKDVIMGCENVTAKLLAQSCLQIGQAKDETMDEFCERSFAFTGVDQNNHVQMFLFFMTKDSHNPCKDFPQLQQNRIVSYYAECIQYDIPVA
eukprot:gene36667-45230_t